MELMAESCFRYSDWSSEIRPRVKWSSEYDEYLEAEAAVPQGAEPPARARRRRLIGLYCIKWVALRSLPCRFNPSAAMQLGPGAARALGRRQQLGRYSEGRKPGCAEVAGGLAGCPDAGHGYLQNGP